MATNTQLKFYKLGANASMPTSGLVTGAIYFVPKEGVIRVATSATTSEPYGGKLQNATWDQSKLKLTITKYDGSNLELDFSDMASSSAVTAALSDIDKKIDKIEASVGLSPEGDFIKNAVNYGGTASTIGGEIKNIDAVVKDISDTIAKMATSDAVSDLQTRMTTAEGEIDVLQAATAGYNADNTVAAAITAAKAEAKTEVVSGDATHVTVTPDSTATDKHVKYTITVNNVVDSTTYTQDQNKVSERIAGVEGDVTELQGQVSALSSATHFEGVVTWNPAEASIGAKDSNGDYTINGAKYQSGDIVIYKPANGQSKEYILDGSTTTPVFIELGDTTASDAAITTLGGRVDTLESWKTEMTKADGTLASMQSDIESKLAAETYDTFKSGYDTFKSTTEGTLTAIDARFDKVDGITGFDSDLVAVASYSDTNYLNSTTSLKAADIALDAVVKAVADRVAVVEGEVAEVVGDNATISVTTDANGKATVSAVTTALAKGATGLAKAGDVFEALCWVEFN